MFTTHMPNPEVLTAYQVGHRNGLIAGITVSVTVIVAKKIMKPVVTYYAEKLVNDIMPEPKRRYYR